MHKYLRAALAAWVATLYTFLVYHGIPIEAETFMSIAGPTLGYIGVKGRGHQEKESSVGIINK